MMTYSQVATVALPIAVAASVFALRSEGQSRTTDWVAFSADVEATYQGEITSVGKFYRGSDGSTRLETGPPGEPPGVISILNYGRDREYTFTAPDGWVERELVRSPESKRPPRGLMQQAYESAGTFEGFVVQKMTTVDGDVAILAPALDHFVLDLSSPSGVRRRYFNVRLANPSPHLFAPPAGVRVKFVNDPNREVKLTYEQYQEMKRQGRTP